MISAKDLIKRSGFYFLFKIIIGRTTYRAYYRKITEINKQNVLSNQSAIVTSNHQNALMDPMAFATHLPGRNIFLARADAFKSPTAQKILTIFKMLPVYRIRDGIDSLKKNEEVFDTCVGVLKLNKKLALFPEGNHGPKRMLRPLVKGVFRIAFKAQSEYGNEKKIKILPCGINYNHFHKFRQTLLIIYGEPIEVSEYWDLYEKNPVEATNAIKLRLSEEIKKLMIHIETDDYYDSFLGVCSVYNNIMRKKLGEKGRGLYAKFKADKEIIRKLDATLESEPQKIEKLDKTYKAYASKRDSLNLRDWVFSRERYSILMNFINLLLCFVTSPMILLGIINNWPHFFIPPIFAKKIKDPQFASTVKWSMGSILLIIYYLALAILALIFIPAWWLKITYIILIPISGILALTIRKIFIKSFARIRYTFNRKKNPLLIEAIESYKSIIEQMDLITNK